MFQSQDPLPDSWYVDETGKVLKVKLLLYSESHLDAVIVETLEGKHQSIRLEKWYELHLSRYCCARNNLPP
jgi:hypothetical protein